MLCNSCTRSVIVQAGIFYQTRLKLRNIGKSLNASRSISYKWNSQVFLMSSTSMMVDSDSTANRGPTVGPLKEKDGGGGFVSGWWKRLVLGSWFCYLLLCLFSAESSRKYLLQG